MKETQWRTKLIQMWRKRTEKGFIWAHDAKFKSGFPDLYTIINGVSCHYELKVRDIEPHSVDHVFKCFEPLQIATLKEIAKAGGAARGLILRSDKRVIVVDFNSDRVSVYESAEFNNVWVAFNYVS